MPEPTGKVTRAQTDAEPEREPASLV